MTKKQSSLVLQRVDRAIEEIRNGRMVILVDDEERENEGDLVLAASLVTPDAINFMAREARGLICLTLTEDVAERLNLPMMVHDNQAKLGTAFTVSIEARTGVTTGISAHDRATTIRTAVAPDSRPEDLVRPGHIFPLVARTGGVLQRTGQTEGSVDLARLAGLPPSGVICEIMNDDGTMARMPDLEKFAARHGLSIVTVADLIQFRLMRERLVRRVGESELSLSPSGRPARAYAYEALEQGGSFLAIVVGTIEPNVPILVRAHSGTFLQDVIGARRSPLAITVPETFRAFDAAGGGVLLYLPPKTPLGAELQAAAVPDAQAVLREIGLGAQVLADLGVRRLRLLTNNPRKVPGLEGHGLELVEHVPLDAVLGPPKAVTKLR